MMSPTQDQIKEARDLKTALAVIQPGKYRSALQEFEQCLATGELTAEDLEEELATLRPLAAHAIRVYRAMTRSRETLL